MKRYILSLVPIVVLFAFVTISPVMAHKVRVFAYETGGEIITEARFNNSRPAKNSTIVISNHANSNVLLEGLTDAKGIFRFDIPIQAKENKMSLNIIVDVGEGHKGSWLLSPSDYLVEEDISHHHPPESQPHLPSIKKDQPTDSSDYSQLEQVVEKIIVRELTPIKKKLAESNEQKLTLRDILGGLGYIFGLAGIAAYFQSKKSGD